MEPRPSAFPTTTVSCDAGRAQRVVIEAGGRNAGGRAALRNQTGSRRAHQWRIPSLTSGQRITIASITMTATTIVNARNSAILPTLHSVEAQWYPSNPVATSSAHSYYSIRRF
jgi:hypothetical protein